MNNKILLVIGREYFTRIRKKSFVALTILAPVLFAAIMGLIVWLGLQEDSSQKIMIIDEKKPVFNTIKSTADIQYEYIENLAIEDAKDFFVNSSYTSLLYIPKNIEFSDVAILYTKKQPSAFTLRKIEREIQGVVELLKLNQFGINKKDFYAVKTDFKLNPVRISEIGEESDIESDKAMVGFIFGLFIYMFIFLYGVQVMRSVIEEKSNRIIEVLATSVKPFHLMMGKIIGIALVGLTQFFAWLTLSAILITLTNYILINLYLDPQEIAGFINQSTTVIEQNSLNQKNLFAGLLSPDHLINRINYGLMLLLFLIYFLGGYLLYSAMFAAVGAAVDSESDTQQFMLPVTLPLILAYLVSVMVIANPEGSTAFWFSMIPFTSPIVMMVRVASGIGEAGIPLSEVVASIVILYLTFIAMVWISGKIYKTAILVTGSKIAYRDLWRWINN